MQVLYTNAMRKIIIITPATYVVLYPNAMRKIIIITPATLLYVRHGGISMDFGSSSPGLSNGQDHYAEFLDKTIYYSYQLSAPSPCRSISLDLHFEKVKKKES